MRPPPSAATDSHRLGGPVAAALLGIFLVQAVRGAAEKAPTFDETPHLAAGFSYLRTGDFRLNPEQPPLVKELAALPLLALHPSLPLDHPSWARAALEPSAEWEFGRQFLCRANGDPDLLLWWGRLPMALLAAGFGWAVFAWSRDLFGPGGGLVSAALFAFCPNLLAHGPLVTMDTAASGFMLLAVYWLWRHGRGPGPAPALAAGIFLGLALAAKHSAAILLPLVPAFLAFEAWRRRTPEEKGWTARQATDGAKALALILAVAALVLCAVHGSPKGPLLYARGFKAIYANQERGYAYYLLGNFSERGFRHYYFAAFAMKSTVPFLALFPLGAAALWRAGARRDALYLLVPVALLFLVTMFDPTNLGLRRVLPAYPFLFVLAGGAARLAEGSRARSLLLIALLACHAAAALRIHPDYLAYFNPIAGGPRRGLDRLDDSNLDWGQDLKALRTYVRERGLARVKVAYYGSVSPRDYGIPSESISDDELSKPEKGVLYAVSAQRLLRRFRDWRGRHQPIEVLGHSIYLYRFE